MRKVVRLAQIRDNVRIMRTSPTTPGGRKNPPATPLLALLRELETAKRRQEFATLAGTSVNYLYQLGTCKRCSCRVGLAQKIAAASLRLNKKYDTAVLNTENVMTMCALNGGPV